MLRDVAGRGFDTVFGIIEWAVQWMLDWNFQGVPLLYWFIGFAVLSIFISFIFG